jgi:two-component system response regulator YesN
MFKTMIVDDIVPTLQYIKQLVNWEELGLQVVATSNSSVMALEKFKELLPDLVITDIGMPQMDGIMLAEQCKQIKRDTRIIFLTCHEAFDYAKRAFQLNADDYLIKDELTADKLEQSLNKSVTLLKTMNSYMIHTDYREEIIRNHDVLKQSFIKQLLRTKEFSKEMEERGRRIGIEWIYDQYMLVHGSIELASYERAYALNDFQFMSYGVYNMLLEIGRHFEERQPMFKITSFLFHSSLLEKGAQHFVIIVNFHKKASFEATTAISGFLHEVQAEVEKCLKIKVGFNVGQAFVDRSQLWEKHGELRDYNDGLYYQDTSINFMDKAKAPPPLWNPDQAEFLSPLTDQIYLHVLKREIGTIQSLVVEAAKLAKAHRIPPQLWISKCIQWIRAVELESKQPLCEEIYLYLQRSQRWVETLKLMESQLYYIQDTMLSQQTLPDKEIKLQTIDRYILDNVAENITTASMAQHLYLNPSYFCRYFKKMTGHNFTDYAHQVKMGMASKLLQNHDDSVESVAFKLGYNDRTYFSKVFKKYIGVSPKNYRV